MARVTGSLPAAAASLAVVVLLATAARASEGQPIRLTYAVHYGLLHVMDIETVTELAADRYRASSEMRTVGVVGVLFPWAASAISVGLRTPEQLRPELYQTTGEYRGRRRFAAVEYDGARAPRVRAEPPPEGDDREPVTDALRQDTVDPLTATLATITSGCRGALRVFDGRRRYDLTLKDLGEVAAPPSSRPIYTGRARRCRGAVMPIAGFWRSQERHSEQPSQIDFWLAAPEPGMMAVPVYIELSAPAGTLAISLTAAAPAPAR